ncbi:hypothetical protein GC173_03705 [bacterium]|nr:hypothetical protein [bacterium]
MSLRRNELMARFLENLGRLGHDVAELHAASRSWAQGTRAQTTLHQVEKDFRLFEARAKALIAEIEHLDAVNRQFTGATVDDSRASRSVPVPHAVAPVAPPRPAAPPPPPAPIPPPEEQPVAEGFQIVEDAPPHPPVTPSSDGRRKLAEMANDLPPSVLAELKKAGLV